MIRVVSFPKSGRTWLRVMLDDIALKARFSHDGSDHVFRRSFSELDADKSRYAQDSVLLLVRDPRDTVVSGYFQVTVQVPYEVSGRQTTTVQLINRGVPSNTLVLTVAYSDGPTRRECCHSGPFPG